uniref:Uncharacterized protein n=1 Tax=Chipolycivirus sp. TaxID=2809300 RepID=A0AAU8JNF5_9VIRU
MVTSDFGEEIPDNFYSSGWNDLSGSQNTHGFFSTPNSTQMSFNIMKTPDPVKMFFTTSTQTNFSDKTIFPTPKTFDTKLPQKLTDLDILNGPSNTRMPWPQENSTFSIQENKEPDHNQTELTEPLESENLENSFNFENLPEFNSVTGMVAGTLNNSIMGTLNQQNYTKTMQGNGPNQGDFNSQRTAQLTLDNRNLSTSIGSTIMSAGSFLGPEGFIAGTVIGAGIDIATEMGAFDSAPASVNTN